MTSFLKDLDFFHDNHILTYRGDFQMLNFVVINEIAFNVLIYISLFFIFLGFGYFRAICGGLPSFCYKSKSQRRLIQDGGCSTIMASIPGYIVSSFYILELKGNSFVRCKRFPNCHNLF